MASAACSAPLVDTRREVPPSTAPPSIAPHPGASAAPPPESAELTALFERVALERGLARGAVPALVGLSRAELSREAVEQLRSSTPAEARAAIEQTLVRLELVPAGFDWLVSLEEALDGRLRAFYAPERRSIFVDRALTGDERRHALTHELVHALQDQHHDLGARLAYAPDAWDRQNALHALAEGDAELLAARSRNPQVSDGPGLGDVPSPRVPDVLSRSLAAAYVDGRRFVEPVLAAGGFAAVDALYRDPPVTTHELLHPSTAPRAPASPLALAPAPEATWRPQHTEVLGEQTWRTVLEEWLPGAEAEQGASGWLGDRLSLFERGDATALVWQLRSEAKAHTLVRSALRAQFGATRLSRTQHEEVVGPTRSRPPNDFDCRAHRDQGVVGVLSQAHDLWFISLNDHEPSDATCHDLSTWAERLKVANEATTRVRSTSSVAADPGRRAVSMGSR